jgi:hypothetical protein
MPLYRKQKPKIYKDNSVPVGNTNSPLAYKQPIPERNIDFNNAKPTASDFNEFIISALADVQNQPTILGTNLPVINLDSKWRGGILVNPDSKTENYIKPIFLGSPGNPTDEFLYANPTAQLDFQTNADCETVFLFANIQAKKNSSKSEINNNPRGFNKLSDKKDKTIPNTITDQLPSDTSNKYQLVFLEQTNNDTKIKINTYDLVVENGGKGVGTVITSPVQLDTWYNNVTISGAPDGRSSRWVDYNIGDNVTIGAVNDTLVSRKPGERFDWSFGSIFLAKTFGSTTRNPDETYREIKYTFDDTGKIVLSDWDYVIADSPTTYSDRYTTKVKLIADDMPLEDVEKLTKEEISNGVVGRKIFTYLIKAFEEGECIRIEEVYGGIRINVDFNYNGRCCEQFITSSYSSDEPCISLIPGNVNEYEITDGKVCVQFDGQDDEVGYVKICEEEIPVSTKNGFLAWNYGTVDEYVFYVFNECQGFYTSSGCYYEICFTGYPTITFTVQVTSISSSSTSSRSYSSSSSSSSSSSLGNSSSSSSYLEVDNSSSSSSQSKSSRSSNSSSSSGSSLSKSSGSSKQSSSSQSTISSSSQSTSSSGPTSSSSSSSNSSSSSSSSLLEQDSSQSDSSISPSSVSSSSLLEQGIESSSRSSFSSQSSRSSTSSSQSEESISGESGESESSNVPLDWAIIYPTDSHDMYALAQLFNDTDVPPGNTDGIVVGDLYGTLNDVDIVNAFTFSYTGEILSQISNLEQNSSYALDVDAQYYESFQTNLVLAGGNFAVQNIDASGNPFLYSSSIYLSDDLFSEKFYLNVDGDIDPFDDPLLVSGPYASCVKLLNNMIYICGPLTYQGRTGFHGFSIDEVDLLRDTPTVTCSISGGSVYNYNVNVGSGAIRDLLPHSDYFTTSEVWAVGDFTTPRKGMILIGANAVSTTTNQLVKGSSAIGGYGYSITEIDTIDQLISSSSQSTSSSSNSSSSQSNSSSSTSSSSNSSDSISDFSSKSSTSSSNSSSSSSVLDNSSSSSSSSKSSSSVLESSRSLSSSSDYSFGHSNVTIIVAGDFINVWDGVTLHPRHNLAFFDYDGTLLNYRIISAIDAPIRKVLYDKETFILWLAGDFTTITDMEGNVYTDKYLIAFRINPENDRYTYVPTGIAPDNTVRDLMITDSKMWLCGAFVGINSKYRPGIGAFNRFTYGVY